MARRTHPDYHRRIPTGGEHNGKEVIITWVDTEEPCPLKLVQFFHVSGQVRIHFVSGAWMQCDGLPEAMVTLREMGVGLGHGWAYRPFKEDLTAWMCPPVSPPVAETEGWVEHGSGS